MGHAMLEETKKRRLRLMKALFQMADQLKMNDGEIATRLGVNRGTIARYRDGAPPKNVHQVATVLADLRLLAGLPGPKANGPVVPTPPPLPIRSRNEEVSTGMEWKKGYQDGFKDGIEYADRLAQGLVKEEMARHG
jgi:hypothetical protein